MALISWIAKRKPDILHYASELKDLKVMPGNSLNNPKTTGRSYVLLLTSCSTYVMK